MGDSIMQSASGNIDFKSKVNIFYFVEDFFCFLKEINKTLYNFYKT